MYNPRTTSLQQPIDLHTPLVPARGKRILLHQRMSKAIVEISIGYLYIYIYICIIHMAHTHRHTDAYTCTHADRQTSRHRDTPSYISQGSSCRPTDRQQRYTNGRVHAHAHAHMSAYTDACACLTT